MNERGRGWALALLAGVVLWALIFTVAAIIWVAI